MIISQIQISKGELTTIMNNIQKLYHSSTSFNQTFQLMKLKHTHENHQVVLPRVIPITVHIFPT